MGAQVTGHVTACHPRCRDGQQLAFSTANTAFAGAQGFNILLLAWSPPGARDQAKLRAANYRSLLSKTPQKREKWGSSPLSVWGSSCASSSNDRLPFLYVRSFPQSFVACSRRF